MAMSSQYKATIGLEIHAELKTKTKMFCGCENNPHDAEPNTNICEVCTAQPGTLPTVNEQAIKKVLLVGTALKSTIASFTEFDRKNYFYPDIPKAYQISQYKFPLVTKGELEGIEITRIHLEEDTARNVHDQSDGSLVDFNRAGVPLMELVTEPVIHDAATAGKFARELQLLLRTLDVSDANMERGEMRVEANISVSKNDTLGTKVEVKNLNSFKSVESAIEYEIMRHIQVLENGEVITQETRGWDENKNKTFLQRKKESADDYRYFPDPDITKYDLARIEQFSQSSLSEILPRTPSDIRLELNNLGITSKNIEVLVNDKFLLNLFLDSTVGFVDPDSCKLASNYVVSDIQGLIQESGNKISDDVPAKLKELFMLLFNKDINSRIAKDLLPMVLFEGVHPKQYAEANQLIQQSSVVVLEEIVQRIIAENASAVAEYQSGKETALKFLLGQGMKASRGAANPKVLEELLIDTLSTG